MALTSNPVNQAGPESRVKLSDAELIREIHDANLSYLMLARQIIRKNRDVAVLHLGISVDLVDILDNLSNLQVIKMAQAPNLLASFRFDDKIIANMLSDQQRPDFVTRASNLLNMTRTQGSEIA